MLTLTLTEGQLNAVKAGLVLRASAMGRQLANLKEQRDSPSNREAVELTDRAIRDAISALLAIEAAEDTVEYPADMTVARLSEAEARFWWGDR